MINIRNNSSKRYMYLANPETIDVVKLDISSKILQTKVNRLIEDGYFITIPEIYKRFTSGLLTKQSFVKIEKPINSGKYIVSNIFN